MGRLAQVLLALFAFSGVINFLQGNVLTAATVGVVILLYILYVVYKGYRQGEDRKMEAGRPQ